MPQRKKILPLKQVYQIKVSLKNIRPPIWRRLLVTSDTTLPRFHMIIQNAMGWQNGHDHVFEIEKMEFGVNDPYDPTSPKDETKIRLSKIVNREGQRFKYIYDYGDYWEHEVLVEKILPLEKGESYPQCIKGKRACPPEDVGGPPGYQDLLEALESPEETDNVELLDIVEDDWDPDHFDLSEANEMLTAV
ncbi:plasmid pRiA4b ORF-3 family protein [Desulfatibacillum aliphaticivorans]|uniref:plasmid pRiA4b ORF-3 family protein n=1 Tax=Desulfatibacillum aliphaticivorans TaxID=218208 RepID=UPI00042114CE|nr:plasmid pRiA4b ORF-3 family protein [Desulfatibacillum aliphaticivorans]